MSDYEDQTDSSNIICPYCKAEYQPDAEYFSENERKDKCDECGKTYRLHQSFSVDHFTYPDCELNSEVHVWEPHTLRDGSKHDFCSVCGKCRPF